MTAGQVYADIRAGLSATVHDGAGDFGIQFVGWPTEHGNRHQRAAAHRIDIADRVGGGDAPEVERVVDDRHEEIRGTDDTTAVAQVVYRGIVAGIVADEQARIALELQIRSENI